MILDHLATGNNNGVDVKQSFSVKQASQGQIINILASNLFRKR